MAAARGAKGGALPRGEPQRRRALQLLAALAERREEEEAPDPFPLPPRRGGRGRARSG